MSGTTEGAEPRLITKRLADLSGLVIGKDGDTGFTWKPWTADLAPQVDKMRQSIQGAKIAEQVVGYLAFFANSWPGYEFTDDTDFDTKRVAIMESPACDIFAGWIQFRIAEYDPILEVDYGCTRKTCNGTMPVKVDLREIEVKVPAQPGFELQEVDLPAPISYDNEERTKATIGPTSWNLHISVAADSVGEEQLAIATVCDAIHGFPGYERRPSLGPAHLKSWRKRHYTELAQTIDEIQPGPDISVKGTCEKCGLTVRQSLPWWADAFFSRRPRLTL